MDHRVTHLRATGFAAIDLALRDCHLFICGAGTAGMHAVHLVSELRDNMPDLPVLCLATRSRDCPFSGVAWLASGKLHSPGEARRMPQCLREPATNEVVRRASLSAAAPPGTRG